MGKLEGKVAERAKEFAAASKRNGSGPGITLSPLNRTDSGMMSMKATASMYPAPSARKYCRNFRGHSL